MTRDPRQVSAYRPWNFWVNVVAASGLVLPRTRIRIYRRKGMRIQTNAVRSGCRFHTSQIEIGENTLVGENCHFENRDPISIGQGCSLAMDVTIVTSSHEIGPASARAGAYAGGPVRIGNGCWIGVRATILPNVTVGDGCVIAAGAVVVDDCEADSLYAGVPARRIRGIDSATGAAAAIAGAIS